MSSDHIPDAGEKVCTQNGCNDLDHIVDANKKVPTIEELAESIAEECFQCAGRFPDADKAAQNLIRPLYDYIKELEAEIERLKNTDD